MAATDGEHKVQRRIAIIGTKRHHAGHIETGNDFSADASPDPVPQARTDKCVVHEPKTNRQRHPNMIGQLQWRSPCAPPLGPVNSDEVRRNAGDQNRFDGRRSFTNRVSSIGVENTL